MVTAAAGGRVSIVPTAIDRGRAGHRAPRVVALVLIADHDSVATDRCVAVLAGHDRTARARPGVVVLPRRDRAVTADGRIAFVALGDRAVASGRRIAILAFDGDAARTERPRPLPSSPLRRPFGGRPAPAR